MIMTLYVRSCKCLWEPLSLLMNECFIMKAIMAKNQYILSDAFYIPIGDRTLTNLYGDPSQVGSKLTFADVIAGPFARNYTV